MPIYAYRCESCGFAKDALQKMSDAPLTQCPSCNQPKLRKQLTAAGFQLKGTGWYATDFRGGAGAKTVPATAQAAAPAGDAKPSIAANAANTVTPSAPAADSKSPAA